MSLKINVPCAAALVAALLAPLSANRNFAPDWTFRGSALTEWQVMGQAEWKADNGEIVGTPKTADGGWLVLNKSYQDVQFATVATNTAIAGMLEVT